MGRGTGDVAWRELIHLSQATACVVITGIAVLIMAFLADPRPWLLLLTLALAVSGLGGIAILFALIDIAVAPILYIMLIQAGILVVISALNEVFSGAPIWAKLAVIALGAGGVALSAAALGVWMQDVLGEEGSHATPPR